MDRKKLTMRAINGEETRPVPYTIWYVSEIESALTEYYGSTEWQQSIHNAILRIEVDWSPKEVLDENRFRDIYGTFWRDGDPRHIEQPALKEPSLKGFLLPSFSETAKKQQEYALAREDCENATKGLAILPLNAADRKVREANTEQVTVLSYGYGLLETAWVMRGYENFFTDLILEQKFVIDLMELLTDRHLEMIDLLCAIPCDGILVQDDYGDQRGIGIGPDRWRAFIKPFLAKLYERIHWNGKKVFHHSCGNVFDIIPDLIEIGIDVLQSVQPEAMPVYEIKKQYGENICLWGGFGTQQLLPFGTPEEIITETLNLKRILGKNGGYIFTTSKPIMADVPVQNAIALLQASIADEMNR